MWGRTPAGDAPLIVLLAVAAFAAAAPAARAADPVKVQLLAFNDFHGHLEPTTPGTITPAPGGARVPAGGIEYFATHVRRLKRTSPRTLLVSAGDLVGGSPLTSALFHDEPTIEAMNLLGLTADGVGNHELAEGITELRRLRAGGCHPTDGCQDGDGFAGADFPFLAANVREEATGRTILRPYVIRRAAGIPIAFVGVVLEDAPSIVSAAGIAGLEFGDEADAINALVPTLRRRGVRAIVVLAHEGGQQSEPGGINDCNGLVGPITAIADRLSPQVDVIHSAHTHQPYVCRRGGRLLTSSASFGRLITDIDLELDPGSRDVAKAEAVNRIVTRDVPRNAAMSRLLARYQALAAPLRDRLIGATAGPLTREQNPAGESTLGDVIADAQLAATRANGALAAFMNPGGIRADLDAGEVTYGEAFTVQPFGNSLVTMTLTGKQVDTLLEQQWCGQDPTFPRILQVSTGVSYTWDPAKPACDRVEDASIRLGGAPVDAAGSYRVTVNSFLADGGDNFVVLREGTDRIGGGDDLDALEAYLAANAPLAVPPLDRIVRAGGGVAVLGPSLCSAPGGAIISRVAPREINRRELERYLERVSGRWPLQRALLGGARVDDLAGAGPQRERGPEFVIVLVSEHFEGVPWLERVYQAGTLWDAYEMGDAADVHAYTPQEFERRRERLPRVRAAADRGLELLPQAA